MRYTVFSFACYNSLLSNKKGAVQTVPPYNYQKGYCVLFPFNFACVQDCIRRRP